MDSKSKNLIIESIPNLAELAKRFSPYQVTNIDLERILYFLTQFDSFEQIGVVIKLMNKIEFLNSSRITALLKSAYDKIDPSILSSPLMSPLGGINDSSTVICYPFLKQHFDKENQALEQITDLGSLGRKIIESSPTSVIFFDDNITSGTQLREFFIELIEGNTKPEMITSPLTKNEIIQLRKIPIRVCYAIELGEKAKNVVTEIAARFQLDLEVHCGKVDFDNHLQYQFGTLDSEDEAKFARGFIREISESLYQEKDWSDEKTYDRLLGYGNLGKLVTFYYNVPKSLIPIFWKYGTFNNKPWIPLFPETQEQKKIDQLGIKYDFFQVEVVRNWIQSNERNRKPEILFGFKTDSGLSPRIEISLVSEDSFSLIDELWIVFPLMKYQPNRHPLPYSPSTQLSDSEYKNYCSAVDNYNSSLGNFRRLVSKYLFVHTNKFNVKIVVENRGNSAATNCAIKLSHHTSDFLIDQFEKFPKPIFEEKKPQISDLNAKIEVGSTFSPSIFTSLSRSMPVPIPYKFEKTRNYNPNEACEYKIISDARIGHNDNFVKTIEITRLNASMKKITIPYEINFDESADTIKGELEIEFTELENLDDFDLKPLWESLEEFKKAI